MDRQQFTTGSPWEKNVGYSRALRVGPFVYVSGTTASDAQGKTQCVGDAAGQTRYILQKIENALMQVGATMRDVVRTRIFVRYIAQWGDIGKVHGEFFSEIQPSLTLVETSGLVNQDHLLEIEVDAIVPGYFA